MKDEDQVPGQLDIYDVLADMGAEPHMPRNEGKAMTDQPDEPILASDVEPATDLSEEELRKQKVRDEVAGRLARRAALRRKGVVSNLDPYSIEAGLHKRDQQQMDAFRKREGKDR